jgi:hypothetical protein
MSEQNEEFNMELFDDEQEFKLNLEEDNPFLDKTTNNTDKNITDQEDNDSSGANEGKDSDTNSEEGKDSNSTDPEDVVSKEKDNDEEDEGNSDTDDSSPDIFTSFANLLAEKGLLSSFDSNNKITSEDDLTELLRSEIDNQSKNYLKEKIGEDGLEALEKGVSLQEYQNYKNTLDTLDSVDEEALESNLDLSKKIILEDYKAQGFSEERALRLLNKSVDLGEDSILEDAKESLQSLKDLQKVNFQKQQEEKARQIQEQKKQQEKIDNDLKNSVYNTDEIIEGIKLNKEIKDRMYNTMTNIVSKNENGIPENKLMKERRENPIEFDTKLYYLYEITKGFKDFSKIINTTKSKVTSDFEKALRSNKKFENSGTPDFLNDSDSYEGIGDKLNF